MIVAAIFVILSRILFPFASAFLMLGFACFFVLFALFSYFRYRSVRSMAEDLEQILHRREHTLFIKKHKEGALSVLECEIQKLTDKLMEQSEQLQAEKCRLQDAIADIFHQVRTPLTSVTLTVSRLGKEELEYESRRMLVRDLRQQIERIRWLTETLLKMSKIDAGTARFKQDRISVNKLFEKALEPFLIPMELAGVECRLRVGNIAFIGDFYWNVEAMSNIIKNALEHFKNSADAHSPEMAGIIDITAEDTPLYTKIVIQDNGGGIAPKDLHRIFERFYKGKYAGQDSVGIGLSLTKMIINAQNGTICAQNSNNGAAFIIKFYKQII